MPTLRSFSGRFRTTMARRWLGPRHSRFRELGVDSLGVVV